MQMAVAFVCTFLLGLGLTLAVRTLARARGIVAAPRTDRWHSHPTALLGGVAIYLSFVTGCLLFAFHQPGIKLILLGGTLLFVTGLVDDFVTLKPYVKLVIQVIVAACVVYFGRRLPWTLSEPLNIFITIMWLVGITNAVNLLDNMDGLAGGITVIASGFLTATLLLNGQTELAMLPLVLGAATLGFLVFNWHPATIFMGDCGSLLLGFALSAMALLSDFDRTRNLGAVLFTPVLILLIPIFDTCVVTVARKLAGRPISQGGRDHTSHRLVALGLSERRAVGLLYALAGGAGLMALFARSQSPHILLWFIPITLLTFLLLGIHLGRVRVYETEAPLTADSTIITALADFPYKRRMFEILLDLALTALAYYGALLLRLDGGVTEPQMKLFVSTLPLVLGVQMLFLLLCGVYRGLWHYAGMNDLVNIAKAVMVGALGNAFVVTALDQQRILPMALLVIYALLLFVLISASRWSYHLLRAVVMGNVTPRPEAQPILISGAGARGALLLRELKNDASYRFAVIGFLDDNPDKVGQSLAGFRVYALDQLAGLIARHAIREVVVSSARIPESRLARLRELGLQVGYLHIRIESDAEGIVPAAMIYHNDAPARFTEVEGLH
jgi:UDP-GlcNAc:undecaprenyl-phosphate/decaprenyl-phosphate GlcNAc-1-phosphate transferase